MWNALYIIAAEKMVRAMSSWLLRLAESDIFLFNMAVMVTGMVMSHAMSSFTNTGSLSPGIPRMFNGTMSNTPTVVSSNTDRRCLSIMFLA